MPDDNSSSLPAQSQQTATDEPASGTVAEREAAMLGAMLGLAATTAARARGAETRRPGTTPGTSPTATDHTPPDESSGR
jgi:hypothetical protein